MTADPRERLQSALNSAYALERELGTGGMATVYAAEDGGTAGTWPSRCCTPSSAPCSAASGS